MNSKKVISILLALGVLFNGISLFCNYQSNQYRSERDNYFLRFLSVSSNYDMANNEITRYLLQYLNEKNETLKSIYYENYTSHIKVIKNIELRENEIMALISNATFFDQKSHNFSSSSLQYIFLSLGILSNSIALILILRNKIISSN